MRWDTSSDEGGRTSVNLDRGETQVARMGVKARVGVTLVGEDGELDHADTPLAAAASGVGGRGRVRRGKGSGGGRDSGAVKGVDIDWERRVNGILFVERTVLLVCFEYRYHAS